MKKTMTIVWVSLMMSLPLALQSGTSAEARNSFQLAECMLESYENLSVELQENISTNSDLLCLVYLQLAMSYHIDYLNCESDPDCDVGQSAIYYARAAYYDYKFMECINVI